MVRMAEDCMPVTLWLLPINSLHIKEHTAHSSQVKPCFGWSIFQKSFEKQYNLFVAKDAQPFQCGMELADISKSAILDWTLPCCTEHISHFQLTYKSSNIFCYPKAPARMAGTCSCANWWSRTPRVAPRHLERCVKSFKHSQNHTLPKLIIYSVLFCLIKV